MKTISTALLILFSTYTADARVFRGNRKLHTRDGFKLKASNQGWYKHRKGASNRGFVHHNGNKHESFHNIRKASAKAITEDLLDASWALNDSPGSYLQNSAKDFCATVQGQSLGTQDLTAGQLEDSNTFKFANMPTYTDVGGEITYSYDGDDIVQTGEKSNLTLNDVLLSGHEMIGDFKLTTGRGLGHDGLLDGRDADGTPLVLERIGSRYAGFYNISQNAEGEWTGTFDAGTDTDQCGQDNCDSGSFVNTVAKLIRAKGLHVRHDDICEAWSATAPLKGNADDADVFNGVHQCNLRATTPRKTYICEKAPSSTAMNGARLLDFHEILQICHDYEEANPGECSSATSDVKGFTMGGFCKVSGDKRECIVDHDYMTNSELRGCEEIVIDQNAASTDVQDLQAALMIEGSLEKINVFQRATRYARPTSVKDALVHTLSYVEPHLADTDNYATSGSIDGCRTARGLVLANYGAALEKKFRDGEFKVEEERFIEEILVVDELVERIGENMELDFVRVPEIAMVTSPGMLISTGANGEAGGMVEQKPFEQGKGVDYRGASDAEYFCGVSHATYGVLEGRESTARTIDEVVDKRKSCVCRGHDSQQATQGPAGAVNYAFGYDELYLQRNNSMAGNCDSLKAYYVTDHGAAANAKSQNLWSVQQYCERFDDLADAEDWGIRVGRLTPSDNNIPTGVNGSGWGEQEVADVLDDIENSLNFEETMNRCGRIVNAVGPDLTAPTIKMSTSGGNDIPYTDATIGDKGLQGKEDIAEVIYQLEVESIGDTERAYSLRSQRQNLGAELNAGVEADEISLSDMVCAPGLTGSDTIFSFRQLRWKDGDYDDSLRRDEYEPSTAFSTWKSGEGNGVYWANNDASTGNEATLENYCIPAWQVVLGVVEVDTADFSDRSSVPAGRTENDVKEYKIDPLGIDARDILEIGYNVHITQKAQKRAALAQSTIEKTILNQLTTVNGVKDNSGFGGKFGLMDMIGFDVYEHYARVAAFADDSNAFTGDPPTDTWSSAAMFSLYFDATHHSA